MPPNSDLFYLSGIEQEQSILLLYPDADDEKQREILFLPSIAKWLFVFNFKFSRMDEALRSAGKLN